MTSSHEATCPVRPGDVLLDKYRVESVLGSGGMGVVVAATHLVLGERVALKFLHREGSEKPEQRKRFLREAQAAARIQGEHVARIHDAGTLPDGTPFLAMELLSGRDLSEVVQGDGPLPPDRAVDYVLQACEALAQAHALGIVHRDLKPSNLFLAQGRDGVRRVKVLDFGISKIDESEGDVALTHSRAVMGSPLYMSPEQVRASKRVDARSDIWSLGVILHELLSGMPPFQGDTASALFASIAADPPASLALAAPGAPAALVAIVARCLQKAPDERFASVAELARALEPLAPPSRQGAAARIARVLGTSGSETLDPSAPVDPASTAATHVAPSPSPQSAVAPSTGTDWGRTGNVQRPGAQRGVMVAAIVALLGVVGAFFAFRSAPEPSRPSPSAALPSVAPSTEAPTVLVLQPAVPGSTASVDASATPPAPGPSASVAPSRPSAVVSPRKQAAVPASPAAAPPAPPATPGRKEF